MDPVLVALIERHTSRNLWTRLVAYCRAPWDLQIALRDIRRLDRLRQSLETDLAAAERRCDDRLTLAIYGAAHEAWREASVLSFYGRGPEQEKAWEQGPNMGLVRFHAFGQRAREVLGQVGIR